VDETGAGSYVWLDLLLSVLNFGFCYLSVTSYDSYTIGLYLKCKVNEKTLQFKLLLFLMPLMYRNDFGVI
jgi:hypothetical protein